MSKYRQYLYRALLVFAVAVGGSAVLYISGIGCVWKYFLHIDCPGCGMTRAVLSLLKGNIAEAFSYHPMVWSLPLLFFMIVFDGKLFRTKWLNTAVLIVIAVGFAANYIFRLLI